MTRVLPLEHRLVEFVARNMRQADRREISATTDQDLPTHCAAVVACAHLGGVIAAPDGTPACVVFAVRESPGVFQAGMFATDRWPEVAFGATRFVLRRLTPAAMRLGVHRVEARSIEGHDQAHRWLEFLGARRICELPGAGKNWETFHLFAWEPTDPRWIEYALSQGYRPPADPEPSLCERRGVQSITDTQSKEFRHVRPFRSAASASTSTAPARAG